MTPCRRFASLAIVSTTAFGLSAATVAPPAKAENNVGRYKMVALPNKPGGYDTRVMILDTSDGHLWQWWELPAIGGGKLSSGITYLGKVTPGSSSGETSAIHRTGPPEPILPRH